METYTRDELLNGLRHAGVAPGDVIFFQSRLYGLGKPKGVKTKEELCEFFLDALLEALGPEGTLVVPAFSTQVARYNVPYIIEETTPNYGMFPEYVFNRPGFLRSLDPLVSVAAIGPLKEQICRGGGACNFGVRSPVDMMARLNAKNIFLGLELKDAVSVVHYIEMHYGVPYLYNKILKWRPIEGGVIGARNRLASVRFLDYNVKYNLDRYQADLFSRGAVKTVKVAGGNIHSALVRDLLEIGWDGLDQDLYYFLDGPPDFDYGRLPFDGPSLQREQTRDRKTDSAGALQSQTDHILDRFRPIAPQFTGLILAVLEKSSPSARKSLGNILANRNELFFSEAELLVDALLLSAGKRGVTQEQLVDGYLRFCMDTLKEQMEFRRSGSYTVKDYGQALKEVYEKDDVMEYYMDGLLLSQVLWDNHWNLLRFARNNFFAPFCLTSGLHLEVGPGHGWFTLLAFNFGAERVTAFDVSEQSLKLTSLLLETQGIPWDKWDLSKRDVQARIPLDDNSADTAMAGEVLEHITDPARFLSELHRVLRPGGAACVTTAVNAPAIDHLFLFETTDQIRDMIRSADFIIENDIALEFGKIGDKPLVNYAAVLRKGARR